MDIKRLLEDSWELVETFYLNNKIHSEFSMQSALYHSLYSSGLSVYDNYKVYVEADFKIESKYNMPDIVIVEDNKIVCFIEIKCSPHAEPKAKVIGEFNNDIDKLICYSNYDKEIKLDYFGPNRSGQKSLYIKEDPNYTISHDAIYCFACIVRSKDKHNDILNISSHEAKLKESKVKNFMYLSGIVEYDENCYRDKNFRAIWNFEK